jgi:hypothetical protein
VLLIFMGLPVLLVQVSPGNEEAHAESCCKVARAETIGAGRQHLDYK